MSDERLREAERRWRTSGSAADEQVYLRERVRAGTFLAGRLELLERMGHFEGPVDPRLAECSASLAEAIVWTCETAQRSQAQSNEWPERLDVAPELGACLQVPADPHYGYGLDMPALLDRRRSLLQASGWVEHPRARTVAGGRLLAFWPDEEISDGSGEEETAGFLDESTCPTPGTWIHLRTPARGRCLVTWVPPRLIARVTRAIDVSAMQCLDWLRPEDDPFAGLLHAAGYIAP